MATIKDSAIETAIAVGRFWWIHKEQHKFYQRFFPQKEYALFLVDLTKAIEKFVSELENGWHEVETHWVWYEFVEAVVKRILKHYKRYKTIIELEKDFQHHIFMAYEKKED